MDQRMPNIAQAQHILGNIKELNEQRSGLELFLAYSEKAKITYLDQHKLYAVVKVSYFEELQKIAATCEEKINQLEEKINQQFGKIGIMSKLMSLKNNKIEELSESLKKYQEINKQLLQHISQMNQNITKSQFSHYEKGIKSEIFQLKLKQSKLLLQKSVKQRNNCQIQTDFMNTSNLNQMISENQQQQQRMHQQLQIIPHQNIKDNDIDEQNQQQIAILKKNFEKVIENLSKQMEKKVKEMQQSKLTFKQWEQQNVRIKTQNQELKTKLKNLNYKEEQLKIWNQSLCTALKNLDDEVDKAQNVDNNLENNLQGQSSLSEVERFNYQSKIKILQEKILKFQADKLKRENNLKEIKEMFEEKSQISEQNIITNMISLSEKVKKCIQFLLQQCV